MRGRTSFPQRQTGSCSLSWSQPVVCLRGRGFNEWIHSGLVPKQGQGQAKGRFWRWWGRGFHAWGGRWLPPPHSRITHTLSTAHRRAQRSAAPKACSSTFGSANVANPPMLREHAQPEQPPLPPPPPPPPPPQQQHLSRKLRYIAVSVEHRQSSFILSGLQPEPQSRHFFLVA